MDLIFIGPGLHKDEVRFVPSRLRGFSSALTPEDRCVPLMGILAKLITYSGDVDHLEEGERWWFSFSTLSDQLGSSFPFVES